MNIDYAPFLRADSDGHIWWRLEDAIKLAAGYVPVRDDNHDLIPALRAPKNQAHADEKTLLGAFHDDRLAMIRPRLLRREDGSFVEARKFLTWLSRYVAEIDATVPFPFDLARAVSDAAGASAESGVTGGFESLEVALEGWFDRPVAELPEALRQRVEEDFFPARWDILDANQRCSVARQWDTQHDPAKAQERESSWNFFLRKREIEQQIESWKAVDAPTATDLAPKESRLAELRQELACLQERRARGDYPANDPEATKGDFDIDRKVASKGDQKAAVLGQGTLGSDKWGHPCEVFLAMEDLTADEISIAFVGDKGEGLAANNMMEISARTVTRRVPLAALDLVDCRNGSLNKQAAILLAMTQGKSPGSSPKISTSVKRLREVFRKHLGIQDDPFEHYRPGVGWKPRFEVSDKRGAADERAKKEGERRSIRHRDDLAGHQGVKSDSDGDDPPDYPTDSQTEDIDPWDDPFELEDDEAGRFLKEHRYQK